MNRPEHLEWVKERALKELDYYPGDEGINNAFASLASDMNKHAETQNHVAIELGMMMLVNGQIGTKDKMREFINGCR